MSWRDHKVSDWGSPAAQDMRCIWCHGQWPCDVAKLRDEIAQDLTFHYAPKAATDEWHGIIVAAKIISTKED